MRFGPPMTPPIVKQLLIANLAVFIAQRLVVEINQYGVIVPQEFWERGYLWQPITYMWMHAGLGHIAMNMFALWMFGTPLAMAWGPKRFLRFYLICGVGAGIFIATYPYFMLPFEPNGIYDHTIGASGAVYVVLLAYSLTWPERTIALIFPPIAFRAIWLIPGLFLFSVMFSGGQNISHIGHLGGVVVAWIYMHRSGHAGALSFGQLRHKWKRYRMRQKLRAVRYEEFERKREQDERRKFH
ncbi:MAG: rhomboid family intramembrane serine protease [Myxococcota bacterium]